MAPCSPWDGLTGVLYRAFRRRQVATITELANLCICA